MSYDQTLAVNDDLAYVPTTLRATATDSAPAVFDFVWPQFSLCRVKGFVLIAYDAELTDEVVAEVGIDLSLYGGPAWWKIQDLTIGALAMPKSGELTVGADYGMKLTRGVTVRITYRTLAASRAVGITAFSWFPAGEIITPPPGL